MAGRSANGQSRETGRRDEFVRRNPEHRAENGNRQVRRPKLSMSPFNSNNLMVQNPYMVMWWSAAMPGAGHIMVGKIVKGFALFLWEFVVNTQSNLNEAIGYSMLGRFPEAKACLDLRWFFMYVPIFIFACWDSYRLTTEVNQFAVLAYREQSPISAMKVNSIEINYLAKTNPWVGVGWSLLAPGVGHLIARNTYQGCCGISLSSTNPTPWKLSIIRRSDCSARPLGF
ncbi:hypothetical protein I8J29_08140 [Paenibacillus sp. MWE-103]|uniref:Uncharacterized protein n=1 Tax=Paenibacillus artemisiicola TaxID=1172618 RepID=A0ABS3W772_9BACL|nr:hypothetical protein [Paenibacillus artemisiicola]MBO7744159.1 hypothetical protein [Paenibacillus artemisiicola]